MGDSLRGSGRTTAQLAALPSGGIYLVHEMKFADYCRRILRMLGRAPDDVRFVAPGNVHYCEGLPFRTPWAADHAYFDLGRDRTSTVRAYEQLAELFPRG